MREQLHNDYHYEGSGDTLSKDASHLLCSKLSILTEKVLNSCKLFGLTRVMSVT